MSFDLPRRTFLEAAGIVAAGDEFGGIPARLLESTGYIQGTVKDTKNNAIGDAQVEVVNVNTGTVAGSTTTDSSGNFGPMSFSAGDYSVRAHKTGFKTYSTTITLQSGDSKSISLILERQLLPDSIDVQPGSQEVKAGESVDFTVTVYDQNANPLSSAEVNASDTSSDVTFSSGSTLMTDSSGQATFTVTSAVATSADLTFTAVNDAGDDPSTGATVSFTATNSAPTADFQVVPSDPRVGEAVSLDASASGDGDGSIESYAWDVDGDGGNEAFGRSTTWTYDSPGDRAVTLTVTDDDGATDSATRSVSVSDTNTGPTASFEVSPESATVGETVTFDASGSSDPDGRITKYAWDFDGDGTYDATGETVDHTYETTGTRIVKLRVTDDGGRTATTEVTVPVEDDLFSTVKENHLATAQAIDSASAAPLKEADRVETYHEDLSAAVADGDVPRDRAVEAVRRLDNAKTVSERGIQQVGPAEDTIGSHNLAREMALPTIKTAFSIAMSAAGVTGKLVQKLPITGKIATNLADQLLGKALGTLLDTMLGSAGEAKKKVREKCKAGADDFLQKVKDGTISAISEVGDAISGILEPIVDAVTGIIRAYFELEMAIPVTPLPGLLEIDLAIDSGLDYLHDEFSVDELAGGSLEGDLSAVQTAASNEIQDVSNEIEQAEDILQDAKEFSERFSIGNALYKLVNGDGLLVVRVGTVLVAAINEIVGGVGNAFAFGAGVGSLMEIGGHNAQAAGQAVTGEVA